ncbi:MAG: RNA-guided endonuclease InsQ/TnpB family protein [Nitrososphaerales archaeon]
MITYKFRIYPTPLQSQKMEETIETCRRLYNDMLDSRIRNHAGLFAQERQLTQVRREDKFLRAIQSHVLQDVATRLDKAHQAFFSGLSRYPKFRRRDRYNSFTFDYTGFRVGNGSVKLSMIGDVRVRFHRRIAGAVKRVAVIRDIDQWFVAFAVEEVPVERKAAQGQVGVDAGVSNIVALSDGTIIENPHFLDGSVERIKSLQRRLSRKRRGSANREKAKLSLAKAWRKVRRQRDDFAHKLSYELSEKNNLIVFEDLRIGNMVKNHNLASAIMDASWGQLRRLTAYKAERRGGRALLVNPSGTSQKCSGCEMVVLKDLSVRTHECPNCGLVIDRDVNAARNILQAGLERARVEAAPLLVQRRRISKFGR